MDKKIGKENIHPGYTKIEKEEEMTAVTKCKTTKRNGTIF